MHTAFIYNVVKLSFQKKMVLNKIFKLLLSALLVDAKMNFKKYHPYVSETEALHSIDRHAKKLERKFWFMWWKAG